MSLISDIGSLAGSDFLQQFGQTGLGEKYSQKITNSVSKTLNPVPKPAPQPAAVAQVSTPVSVTAPERSEIIKKVAIAAAGVMGVLVVIYFIKKGR